MCDLIKELEKLLNSFRLLRQELDELIPEKKAQLT